MTIQNALISVYYKDGIDELARFLDARGVRIYSTGGTYEHLVSLGLSPVRIETLTGFPEILEGRVKTLHPAVFSGILAKRNEVHQLQLQQLEFPNFDLVVVNLYPFEQTVASGAGHAEVIEKIDIGGVSLIRAAAKNYAFVNILCDPAQYKPFMEALAKGAPNTTPAYRGTLAEQAFTATAAYDKAIMNYFKGSESEDQSPPLKYGENPHQQARLEGSTSRYFEILAGKPLSFNNLLDIEAALRLYQDFPEDKAACAILKHNNPCGIAFADDASQAWQKALACDPVSAFGGIILINREVDEELAGRIDEMFYEVLLAPTFSEAAFALLSAKKNRILLRIKPFDRITESSRSFLGLNLIQSTDLHNPLEESFELVSGDGQLSHPGDLGFAMLCAKHLKSNAIAIVKDYQLIGAGSGQTSRVDALRQAVRKVGDMGFDTENAVVGSDAFFPFSDSVQLIFEAGIKDIIQPGGSMRDQEVIDYCNAQGMNMWFTGIRHFKH